MSSPKPSEATSGSTQPGTRDRLASASAAATHAEAPSTHGATPRSPTPSIDSSAPSTRRARSDSVPPDTRTTTAHDPPSTDSTREPNVAQPRPRNATDDFLNPTPIHLAKLEAVWYPRARVKQRTVGADKTDSRGARGYPSRGRDRASGESPNGVLGIHTRVIGRRLSP